MTQKQELQQRIKDRFGDWQIEAKRQPLCHNCQSFYYQHCEHGLLPVTSDGSNCPYWEPRRTNNADRSIS